MINGFRRFVASISVIYLAGCYSLPQSTNYPGPVPRPYALEEYYGRDDDIQTFAEENRAETEDYVVRRYYLTTKHGPITIDYYKQPVENDNVVFVFPVLGGKKMPLENYFCHYFAKHGLDAAIIHRSDDFKKPENFDRIEELNRENVIRDRLAIDFFEQQLGKKRFGTFGLSRGAINVAVTAGVDKRLEYNVMALGGTDLVRLFHKTDQPRVRMIMAKVMKERDMTWPQLSELLYSRIKTDPKNLARYMDARKSLVMLSLFDRTVPIQSGFRLRHELGNPETIVLMSGHYTAAAYTGFLKLIPPSSETLSVFPVDYVESEALQFFKRSFGTGRVSLRLAFMRALRLPFDVVGRALHLVFERHSGDAAARVRKTPWDGPMLEASATNMCLIR